MRIALLTEGGYPYARGESALWCDRLLRSLARHEFDVCALSRTRQQARGPRCPVPGNVVRVRTAPLWGQPPERAVGESGGFCSRLRRRIAESFTELTAALCTLDGAGWEAGSPQQQADRFATGLYGLAGLALDHGGLSGWLRQEEAVRVLERACRTPGAPRAVHGARAAELLAVTTRLERVLRPLSLNWYGVGGSQDGLAQAQLCHAVGTGPAALAGLLARRFFGTPLLVTEFGTRLDPHRLGNTPHAVPPSAAGAPVRALLTSFQARLAQEVYATAALVTPGNREAGHRPERPGALGAPGARVTEAGTHSGLSTGQAVAVFGRIYPELGSGGPWPDARRASAGVRTQVLSPGPAAVRAVRAVRAGPAAADPPQGVGGGAGKEEST